MWNVIYISTKKERKTLTHFRSSYITKEALQSRGGGMSFSIYGVNSIRYLCNEKKILTYLLPYPKIMSTQSGNLDVGC